MVGIIDALEAVQPVLQAKSQAFVDMMPMLSGKVTLKLDFEGHVLNVVNQKRQIPSFELTRSFPMTAETDAQVEVLTQVDKPLATLPSRVSSLLSYA